MGGSSVQLEIIKNWKTYFYTLFYYVFGRAFERLQRYKCADAFVLASMYRYSWLITFVIFFLIEGWVGCIVSKLFLDFIFIFIYKAPYTHTHMSKREVSPVQVNPSPLNPL